MTTIFHIDRFSAGLDDLTHAQQADHIAVLRVLDKTKRFSVFEATDNIIIARTMTRLLNKSMTLKAADGTKTVVGLLLKNTGGDYPWTTVELTDAGKKLLLENPA